MPPKEPNTQANPQPIPQQEPPVRNIRTDPHGISRINFINYKTTYEENQHLRDPQHVIKTPEQIAGIRRAAVVNNGVLRISAINDLMAYRFFIILL